MSSLLPHKRNSSNSKHILGFGLIELLIAVALSTIVSIVVVQLFTQNKSSYLVQESATRLNENGRYAIQLLTNDIRSADFWGCRPSLEIDTQNDPPWPGIDIYSNVANLPAIGIAGFISGVTGIEGAVANGLGGYPTQPDTLVISGIKRGRSFPLDIGIEGGETAPLQISLGNTLASGIQPNEIMLISDCQNAQIFQVTNDVDTTVSPSANGVYNVASLAHAIAPFPTMPASTFNNIDAEIKPPFGAELTTVYRGVATNTTYTINPAFDHDGDGPGGTPAEPTLMRSEDGGAPQAIVPGVETLQLMFGEDTNVPYDFQADRYVTANNVTDWNSVVSVRISLLVRTPDANNRAATAYTLDGVNVNTGAIPAAANGLHYSRKVYTTTITVRNRMS
ncbi:MAG: PilW family protein [Gammaproteobacteria bacterium]